jgi:hypothetical protein
MNPFRFAILAIFAGAISACGTSNIKPTDDLTLLPDEALAVFATPLHTTQVIVVSGRVVDGKFYREFSVEESVRWAGEPTTGYFVRKLKVPSQSRAYALLMYQRSNRAYWAPCHAPLIVFIVHPGQAQYFGDISYEGTGASIGMSVQQHIDWAQSYFSKKYPGSAARLVQGEVGRATWEDCTLF